MNGSIDSGLTVSFRKNSLAPRVSGWHHRLLQQPREAREDDVNIESWHTESENGVVSCSARAPGPPLTKPYTTIMADSIALRERSANH